VKTKAKKNAPPTLQELTTTYRVLSIISARAYNANVRATLAIVAEDLADAAIQPTRKP
jgi:hypothetical protein